jgi:hypothetical protein
MVVLVLLALVASVGCAKTMSWPAGTTGMPGSDSPEVTAPVVPAESTFIIQVTGTTGDSDLKSLTGSSNVKFTGGYMVVAADGSSTSQSVEGTVPAQYNVSGTIVSCEFQNQFQWGALIVTILKNGSWAAEASTSAAYGVVTVATP